MPQVIVRAAATADIREAYQWYEGWREGLGDEFLAALTATQNRDVEFPESFPMLQRGVRGARLPRRFPYGLFYRIDGDAIIVVACMHARRDPRQWQNRE